MNITKKQLQKLYWEDGLSTHTIAKEIDCSRPTVRRKMIEFDIPRRTYKDNPTPVKKGEPLSRQHRKAISDAQKKLVIEGKRRYDNSHSPAWKGGKVTVCCTICNTPIEVTPARLKRTKHFFCNDEHFAQWQSERMKGERVEHINITCGYCSKPMHVRRKRLEASISGLVFCSTQHSSLWYGENIRGSRHWNWKGGYEPYYGDNWHRQRHKARRRDGYTCQGCGIAQEELDRELDVHHIISFRVFLDRYGGDVDLVSKEANKLSNLISYCPSCHHKNEGLDR